MSRRSDDYHRWWLFHLRGSPLIADRARSSPPSLCSRRRPVSHHIRSNCRQREFRLLLLGQIENALTKLLKYATVMCEPFHRASLDHFALVAKFGAHLALHDRLIADGYRRSIIFMSALSAEDTEKVEGALVRAFAKIAEQCAAALVYLASAVRLNKDSSSYCIGFLRTPIRSISDSIKSPGRQ